MRWKAAAAARAGATVVDVAQLLDERTAGAFAVSGGTVSWRALSLTAEDIEAVRSRVALSFGSCSFEEPLAELREEVLSVMQPLAEDPDVVKPKFLASFLKLKRAETRRGVTHEGGDDRVGERRVAACAGDCDPTTRSAGASAFSRCLRTMASFIFSLRRRSVNSCRCSSWPRPMRAATSVRLALPPSTSTSIPSSPVRTTRTQAFHHYTTGGELSIDAGCDDQVAWLEVSDTGTGIPQQVRDRIFAALA
mgnify:CR=1 FL=1